MAKFKLPELTLFNKTPGKKPEETEQTQENPGVQLARGMVDIKDIIAPSAIEVDFNHLKVGATYYRTLFVSGYPRFVGANWLEPIINFSHSLDISMFYYPVKAQGVLEDLKRKITELEATVRSDAEKGKIADPVVSAALEDANTLQEQLVKGVEKFFQFSFYITIPAEDMEELENVTKKLEGTLGSLLLISKKATLQMEQAFQATIPAAVDKLLVTRNMDTTSLATTFPFTSSDLTSDEGIMYGINKHNGSLIIFDRFSLENANTVVFAKSGAGKSYAVKLEALRSIVFGTQIIIIDPEEEYRPLCKALGGDYIDFSPNSQTKINPFDLSGVATEGRNELGQKLLSLTTIMNLMLGEMNPTETALMDRALMETYRLKGITPDPDSQASQEPPIMEDLYKVLLGNPEQQGRALAERLERFVKGSMTGIFDTQSNVNLNANITVFSTKNLEEALRPIAFYIILDFIWTRIRRDLRRRILIVEEAWYLMENEDSAQFLFGIAKRARKYYLGLTTITQDVDDFLNSQYGHAVVSNSSIQMLFKQHPAAIDKVAEVFYLSEGEKRLLLAADRGEGLFFAGANHVAMRVVASEEENKLITTNPEELLRLREEEKASKTKKPVKKAYKPVQNYKADQYEKVKEVPAKKVAPVAHIPKQSAPQPKPQQPASQPKPQQQVPPKKPGNTVMQNPQKGTISLGS
jgi:conjugal transfer ATP-binding protein TraC